MMNFTNYIFQNTDADIQIVFFFQCNIKVPEIQFQFEKYNLH